MLHPLLKYLADIVLLPILQALKAVKCVDYLCQVKNKNNKGDSPILVIYLIQYRDCRTELGGLCLTNVLV
jgi:hypothetical protein